MSFDLRELYQEIIIEHNRNPHNHYAMSDADAKADGYNPLCGDKLTIYLKIKNNLINELSFVGSGCAISQASASLMTEALIGKTIEEADQVFTRFHKMLTEDGSGNFEKLDRLEALAGVKAYPARVKCATLAWHTLNAALHHRKEMVSTE